jgi:hypothetical protein
MPGVNLTIPRPRGGPKRYDVGPDVSTAELNLLIQRRAEQRASGEVAFTVPVLLAPGVYRLEQALVRRSGVALQGAGRGRTIFKPASSWAPAAGLADDPSNTMLSSPAGLVNGGFSTTLSANAFRGDYNITVASGSGIQAGDYLRIQGAAGLTEVYATYGANVISTGIYKVASVNGTDVVLAHRLRQTYPSGATVVEYSPMLAGHVSGIEFDADGKNFASAVDVVGVLGDKIVDCAFKDFTRAPVCARGGSENVTVADCVSLGGNNALVHGSSAHSLRVRGWTGVSDGDRFHPSGNGYKRHAVTLTDDCDHPLVTDNEFIHAGAAVLLNTCHRAMIRNNRAIDCYPDPVHDSLVAAGEQFINGRLGIFQGGYSDVADGGAGLGSSWHFNTVSECYSEYPPIAGKGLISAFWFHDDYFLDAYGNMAINDGVTGGTISPAVGSGNQQLWGVCIQDVSGFIRDTIVRGLSRALFFCNDIFPVVDNFVAEGATGASENAVDPVVFQVSNDVSIEIHRLRVSNFGQGYNAITEFLPTGLRVEDVVLLNTRWALNLPGLNATGSTIQSGEWASLDVTSVIARMPQLKVGSTASGETQWINVCGDASLNGNNQVMMWCPLSADYGHARVRAADVVAVGDKLIPDNTVVGGTTGKHFRVDNTATSGFVRATSVKSGTGSAALVTWRKP